jgi:uncharacterized protein DUF3617
MEDSVTPKLLVRVLLAILPALTAAQAAEAVKPGLWQYTVTMQMPQMPQLPPGVKLPPNLQMQTGPGGMTVTNKSCVSAADPTAELSKPHGPPGTQGDCTVDKTERHGGTISWATTCTMPGGAVRQSAGTAHYQGDQMEADFTSRVTSAGGSPIETKSHVSGRYLGPCQGK